MSTLNQQQLSLEAAQKSFVQISGLSLFNYVQPDETCTARNLPGPGGSDGSRRFRLQRHQQRRQRAYRAAIARYQSLQLTSGFALRPEVAVAGIAFFLIIDPLAPNWKIEQSEPYPGEFHLALKMKPSPTRAAATARQGVFMRRVSALVRERDANAGRLYRHGVHRRLESTLPFAQRVAYGVEKIAAAQAGR